LVVLVAACGLPLGGTLESAPPPEQGGPDATAPEGAPPDDGTAPETAPPDGCVIDASTSCGVCGRSCNGGACVEGECAPVTLGTVDPAPATSLRAVVVDASSVYFAEAVSGDIYAAPIAGGARRLVYATAKAPRALAVDVDRLFWVDQFKLGLFLFDGGVPPPVLSATQPFAIAYATPNVRLTNAGGDVLEANRDLSATRSIAAGEQSPFDIAAGADHFYWVDGGDGLVKRAARAGGPAEVVVAGEAGPMSVAVDGTRVYWTTAAGAVRAAPLAAGTTATTLVSGESSRCTSLEVDGSGLYWLDATGGAVRAAPLSGGPARTLAAGVAQRNDVLYTQAIALDAQNVYFIASVAGLVQRVAK
jgi:hypothetical protein